MRHQRPHATNHMKKVKHTKQATRKPIYFMKHKYVRDRQACKITSRSCQQQRLVQDLPSAQGHNALPISSKDTGRAA